ncbi:uncharacterized protein B0I36DRAFT_358806 [Microdochium trichocladiopsis]|uniref:Uncharacterized protein n=1 Tax=Microdochium trichocladiopsis TaxID=1682393 RepID=A0A9P8YFJ5_9PEZI|nr:uncharacterized protein B0I36DRAFT_358806 [Microdochium trichocladiopsis]KAH7037059.1 hypothetical protein B0I36DRAFT_358806 [Microdochium trichocladiopsis]
MRAACGWNQSAAGDFVPVVYLHRPFASFLVEVGAIDDAVSGPLASDDGAWNTTEWFPSLMKTSNALQVLPGSLGGGPIDWILVDTMAAMIHQISQQHRGGEMSEEQVFNLANPNGAQWSSLIPKVLEARAPGNMVVPLAQWVQRLATEVDVERLPALKILEFFLGMATDTQLPSSDGRVKLEIGLAAKYSKAMTVLEAIGS